MLRVRDGRARALLAIGLLLVIGYAVYQIGVNVWTSRMYHAAGEALERYDYAQASAHLKRYLSYHPNDPSALVLAAQTSRRQGDFDEAVRQLGQAEKHGAPADALVMERRLLSVQAGDKTDIDRLTQVCTERPDSPETALILEAIIKGSFRSLNNLSLAKWGIDLWLEHRPGPFDQAQGLVWRARLSEYSQDLPHALVDYRRAVELAPEHLRARLRLVEALLREEPREAIPHVDWLCAHRPEDAEVRLQTARLRRNLGQAEEAARLLDALLADTPNNVPALVERGRIALDLHRPQDAQRWLDEALTLAPNKREVNLALADCLRQAGRLHEAKHYQDKAQAIEARQTKALADQLGASAGKK